MPESAQPRPNRFYRNRKLKVLALVTAICSSSCGDVPPERAALLRTFLELAFQLVGPVGLLGNLASIMSLADHWRGVDPLPSSAGSKQFGRTLADVGWLYVLNGIALVLGCGGNVLMLVHMELAIEHHIAVLLTSMLFLAALVLYLIMLGIAEYSYFGPSAHVHRTIGYWQAACAASLYAVAVVITLTYALRTRHQRWNVLSSRRQRLVTVLCYLYFFWIAGGAAIFHIRAMSLDVEYAQDVYFVVVSCLTLGYGDIVATSTLGKMLVIPLIYIGIILGGWVALAVFQGNLHKAHNSVVDMGVEARRRAAMRRHGIDDGTTEHGTTEHGTTEHGTTGATSVGDIDDAIEVVKAERQVDEINKLEGPGGDRGEQDDGAPSMDEGEQSSASSSLKPSSQQKLDSSMSPACQEINSPMTSATPSSSSSSVPSSAEASYHEMRKIVQSVQMRDQFMHACLTSAWLCAFLLFGALIFHFTENWAYSDAFYMCAISLVEVGYGDFVPTSPGGRALFIHYALIAMPTTAAAVSDLGAFLVMLMHKHTNADTLLTRRFSLPAETRRKLASRKRGSLAWGRIMQEHEEQNRPSPLYIDKVQQGFADDDRWMELLAISKWEASEGFDYRVWEEAVCRLLGVDDLPEGFWLSEYSPIRHATLDDKRFLTMAVMADSTKHSWR